MSYFRNFPLVRLNDGSLGINITARTKIPEEYKNDPNYYYEHSIVDGETPEILADKFYDDPEIASFIMLFNDRLNIYTDWPMDQYTLDEYIQEKYDNPYAVHHYESLSTGNIVDIHHMSYDRIPITNYEYEVALNDSKRKIKLIIPDLIASVVAQHRELMSR